MRSKDTHVSKNKDSVWPLDLCVIGRQARLDIKIHIKGRIFAQYTLLI